ncbi:MAG TPA: ATP-binding protein [Mucilaginibacter sp.]|jgi:AAA15 family ATPase/GTPase|nr:ATP-binding protein [Mucilaginibacter sp.]
MLVYFKVGNYKSIKDPIVINFNAAAISEHQETNVYSKGKNDLLKTVLLYGPNASGKSKIMDAFVFFRWSIINSATDTQSKQPIDTEPFLLNTRTRKEPSFFEAEFFVNKTKFRYGFEADEKAIRKEWLLEVKATTSTPLFLRIGQKFEINDVKFPGGLGLDQRTRPNALFLSVAAQWNTRLGQQIVDWFDSIYTVHGMMDHDYKNLTTSMLKEIAHSNLINELIQKADLGIKGLEILDINEVKDEILNRVPVEMREEIRERIERDLKPVFATHNVYNDHGKVVDETPFSMATVESEGTRKFYNLAGLLVDAVHNGRLVVIDELDARLHTLLTRAIIQLFNSEKMKTEAQLFAASHDTALLDKDLLRRDQIYFVEKDQFSATRVTTLAEYKPRKETPYYKNYLEGKYGAIPFIENLETVLTHGEEK